jgi:hypothetical protein
LRRLCGILRHEMIADSRKDPKKLIPAPAGYVRFVLKRFGTTDDLRAGLVAGTDIDEERLNHPGAEVTPFTFVTLSENLTRQVGEAWPLDCLPAWGTAMQGALEAAVRSAPTLGEGLDVIGRFGHVRAPFLRIEPKRDAGALRLVCEGAVQIEPATWRSLSLAAMLGVTSMLVPLLEGRMSEVEVRCPNSAFACRSRSVAKSRRSPTLACMPWRWPNSRVRRGASARQTSCFSSFSR